jgi:hypothetical protein
MILHKDDVPWMEAPLPRRRHRCEGWTIMVESSRDSASGCVESVHRCACGAINVDRLGWSEKNSRHK